MANPAGESNSEVLRLDFDRRLMVQFRGSVVTSDAGLIAYRELDEALGLSALAGEMLADARTGRNGRHALVGMLRQSVFGRLAGYEFKAFYLSKVASDQVDADPFATDVQGAP
jgi:Transposase DDE domain group 1